MIQLVMIEVLGQSEAGPFRGTLDLSPGLQVISARNAYGKSLAAKAIAWALGLEPLFGLPANDPSFLPIAVREEVDFDDRPAARILSSECSIRLIHSDGRRLRLTREIKGVDPSVVFVEETAVDGTTRQSKLQTGFKAMQDEHGGLQYFMFGWLGWPRARVATFKGEFVDVYLENLAPLFYIEQDEGWTDLQARQVTRYAQHQIAQVAVEYLLGATDAVSRRAAMQGAILKAAGLRESARVIADRVNALTARHGWSVDWSGHGKVENIVTRWSSLTIRDALKRDAHVDLAAQRISLTHRVDSLRRTLIHEPLDPANASAHAEASQKAITLKQRRHEISKELGTFRIQYAETEELLASLEHRIHAAADVLRLKTSGVGRLELVECPICHRALDPATFALTEQSQEEVRVHIEALKRDRDLIKRNLEGLRTRIIAAQAETERIDVDLRNAERALVTVTEAVGTVREQLAQTAANLAAVEREIDRLAETARELDDLQRIVDQWLEDAREIQEPVVDSTDLQRRVGIFTDALREYLIALGHSAVNQGNASAVRLDEQYVPFLGTRRLRSLGSASDRSRLVAAYSLALAASSHQASGLHPGVVLLDEPLQQNPDDPHRDLFSTFLSKGLALHENFQTIIFTSLRQDEIQTLRQLGTTVVTPEGEHFLQLITPLDTSTAETEASH